MIRVGLADDQALVRSRFAALREAANGEEAGMREAGRTVHGHQDAGPGRHRGREEDRRSAWPGLADVHVVILTTFELDEYIFDGLRAGAAGFLVKEPEAA